MTRGEAADKVVIVGLWWRPPRRLDRGGGKRTNAPFVALFFSPFPILKREVPYPMRHANPFPDYVFHLTHPEKWWRIAAEGLQVKHDARKVGRIWFAEYFVLDEIAVHLNAKDNCKICVYIVLRCHRKCLAAQLKKSGRYGVYYVERDVFPHLVERVGQFFVDSTEKEPMFVDNFPPC